MKIAIDGSATSIGGGATYLCNLLLALAQLDQESKYIVICTQDQTNWTVELPQNFQYIRIPLHRDDVRKRIWWMQTNLHKLLQEHNVDILYSPNDQTSLFVSCPVVLGIQNPNPYTGFSVAKGVRNRTRLLLLKQMTRVSARKASKVIFVSNLSKHIISKQLSIPDEKGTAIHHGVSSRFSPDVPISSEFKKRQPYILSVSTIYRQKNYITLIRAFAKLLKEHGLPYNLLIAGRTVHADYFAQMKQLIAEKNMASHVHLLGEIEHARTPGLYAGARLFAFPSYLETFGLPPVEAMASGVPVVSSNASVIPEICGDAALYSDPFDPDGLAEAMYRLLMDESLWQRMRYRGLERARGFSWTTTAQKTSDVLKSARL